MALENKKITDLTEKTAVPEGSFIHVVDTSDFSQDPSGSSFKIKKSNLISVIKSNESLSLAKRKNDVLYGILDQHTGESISLSKVTGTLPVDNIINFQLGSEYFTRNIVGNFNVKWFGAKGDGITDDTVTIQASIDRLTNGGTLFFPKGKYKITSSLLIYRHGMRMVGEGDGFMPTDVNSTIIYDGNDAAVLVSASTVYRFEISRLSVRASGVALTSSTAIGIKFVNSHYGNVDRCTVRDFNNGTGILFTGVNNASVTNTINCTIHECFIGIDITGTTPAYSSNHIILNGGGIIGKTPVIAGSIGIACRGYGGGHMIYGTDIELFETGLLCENMVDIAVFGIRTEDITLNHINISPTCSKIQIFSPMPYGSGTHFANYAADTTQVSATDTKLGNTVIHNNKIIYLNDTSGSGKPFAKMTTGNIVLLGSSGTDIYSATNFDMQGNEIRSLKQAGMASITSASASVNSLFRDSADNKLKYKDDLGTVNILY